MRVDKDCTFSITMTDALASVIGMQGDSFSDAMNNIVMP